MSSKMVSSSASDDRSAYCWPEDVGIIAMEVYFPSQYVEQEELEQFDEVSQGKYTIGLGQRRMGFCTDCEDINSLCLTALTKLVENTGISYSSIGRLEVGTETVIDKSKSVKTALMAVLAAAGNTDVEGIDTHNACYGGTAALLNAVNWIESSAWDGRLAVVLAGDIAVYATGAARPTGGAGAVAMLVGPHAPLVLDRGIRSSHMNHAYDFYKPDLSSQYPRVDGKLSIQCYFSALDTCYNLYLKKAKQKLGITNLNNFDALLFHTPYCKLVQKSVARLAFNDFLNTPLEEVLIKYPGLEAFRKKTLEETYFDRDIEKAFLGVSSEAFENKTKPSLLLASLVGNMYTPSLYGGLASLLYRYSRDPSPLIGKRLCLFSYGSGLASTMFSIQVKCGRQLSKKPLTRAFTLDYVTAKGCASMATDAQATNGADNCDHDDACSNGTDPRSTSDATTTSEAGVGQLADLVRSLADLEVRLEARRAVTPREFSDAMQRIEDTHHLAPHAPVDPPNMLVPGTWHLTHVDALHRRHYARVPLPRQQQQPEVQELHLQQELGLGGPAAAATVAVAKCVLAPAASPAV